MLGPDNFTPGLQLPAFASASRRLSANVESYKFLTSTPATRRGGQARAPRGFHDAGHRDGWGHFPASLLDGLGGGAIRGWLSTTPPG